MSIEVPGNFLDLVQRTRLECGVSGTGPSAVAGQIGEAQRLVAWVSTAWMKIQTKHLDWGFKRLSASFATVNGQATYTTAQAGIAANTFGQWIRDTFRNYDTVAGLTSEVFMDYMEYDAWRNNYLYGALRDTRTRPVVVTIAPDKSLGLGPVPNAAYTVTGDYFKRAIAMVSDTDVPDGLPAQFNMVIVYQAMQYYALYESAPEVYQHGQLEYNKLMAELEADRLPEVRFTGALM